MERNYSSADRQRGYAFHSLVRLPGARMGGWTDDGCGRSLRGDVVFGARRG
jgi:hypothetical protein